MEIKRVKPATNAVNLNLTTSIKQSLTPEIIAGKLFSYHNKAHFYHLQTDTIGKHLLLDELYKGLVDSKDAICEFMLGSQAPTRFASITIDQIEPYSESALMSFINEGVQFSIDLCNYADMRGLEELCNLSSELQGIFTKAKLFITYK